MTAKARVWGAVGILLASFAACSNDDVDAPVAEIGGEGPRAGTAGERSDNPTGSPGAAGASASGDGGTSKGGAGDGGAAGNAMAGNPFAGVSGCSIEDQCGGCEAGRAIVKCSWGNIDLPQETLDSEACAVATQLDEASAGGAGGQTGTGGEGPGICATYEEPGIWITGCNPCTETDSEYKIAECVLRNECCVLVVQRGCGV